MWAIKKENTTCNHQFCLEKIKEFHRKLNIEQADHHHTTTKSNSHTEACMQYVKKTMKKCLILTMM